MDTSKRSQEPERETAVRSGPATVAAEATGRQEPEDVARARRVGQLLFERDPTIRALGISLEWISPGKASVALTVSNALTNAIGTCHGGYVFLLADTAFAFAANSDNRYAVSAAASIEFLAPAREGDRLLAQARLVEQRGRQAWFDLSVEIENGPTIALGRARAVKVEGRYYEE